MKTKSKFSSGFAFLLIAATEVLIPPVKTGAAGLSFTLQITQEITSQYRFGGTVFTGLGIGLDMLPAVTSTNSIYSTHSNHSLHIGPGYLTGGGYLYGTLDEALIEATNGLWTLVADEGSPTQKIYHFSISLPSLGTNDYAVIHIVAPADGAVNVTPTPVINWTSSKPWNVIDAELIGLDFDPDYTESLAAGTTSWSPPASLPQKRYDLNLTYQTNAASWVTIGTPIDSLNQPCPGWASASVLWSRQGSRFTVGPPSPLVAHLRFDNSGWLGMDSSTYENNANETWFNNPPVYDAGGVDGGAARFTQADGGWLAFGTGIEFTLTNDFTVAVWVKTTQVVGRDSDQADQGAGLVWGDNPGVVADTIPLALNGSKAGFMTGDPDETLHTTVSINTGNWVHLVATRTGATGEKNIFVNGVLQGSGTGTTAPLDAVGNLNLGYGNGGNFYQGLMDDLQIYMGVVSSSNIMYMYQNPGVEVPVTAGSVAITIAEAVDAPSLTWTTGGDLPWFGQNVTNYDGVDAAQSGAISDLGVSWVETSVSGPGRLSFRWKVSSKDGSDYLYLYQDGFHVTEITGDVDWDQFNLVIPPGAHRIRWSYEKDSCCTGGYDAGWLDTVSFSPEVLPVITQQPQGQTAYPGYDISLAVGAYGSPAPQYQWRKGGVPIGGATNAMLTYYSPVDPGVAGNYDVIVSNSQGYVPSDTAIVAVNPTNDLPADFAWARQPQGTAGDFAYDTATDPFGNVYVNAGFYGTNDYGGIRLTNTSAAENGALVKYNAAGQVLWARHFVSTNFNLARRVETDAAGNPYVAGFGAGNTTVDGVTLPNAGNEDAFLVKFDPDGNVLWGRTIGGPGNEYAWTLAVDGAGNATIAGLADMFADGGIIIVPTNRQSGFVAQYDAAGTLAWARTFNGNPWGAAAGTNGATYVAGSVYFQAGETSLVFGSVSNSLNRKFFLLALNPDGSSRWLDRFGPVPEAGNPIGLGDDAPRVVAAGNQLFVVGTAYTNYAVFDPFGLVQLFSDNTFAFLAQYDTNGNSLGAQIVGNPTSRIFDIGTDGTNAIVGSIFTGVLDFNGHVLARPPGYSDLIFAGIGPQSVLVKYGPAGEFLWARAPRATGAVYVNGVAASGDAVYSAGFFVGDALFGAYPLTSTANTNLSYTDRSLFLARIGGLVPSPVQLTVVASGANVTVSFPTQAGYTHILEASSNLSPPSTWLPISTNIGDGSLKSIDLPAIKAAEFFRLRTQ